MVPNTLLVSLFFIWSCLVTSAFPLVLPRINDPQKWQFLTSHNDQRAQHGANALNWSDDLANAAQQWASECQLNHYDGGRILGENIVAGSDGFSVSDAVAAFTGDKGALHESRLRCQNTDLGFPTRSDQYNPDNSYLHWTQVVWKDTTGTRAFLGTNTKYLLNQYHRTWVCCRYLPQSHPRPPRRHRLCMPL